MTRFHDFQAEFNPLGSSSRFNRRPAIAFVPGEQIADELYEEHGDKLDEARRSLVEAEVGPWVLEAVPELGEPELHDGGYGVGAEAWAVVLEWLAQGVVGGAGWLATVAAARRLRALVDRLLDESKSPNVSAGAARLLAIDAVLANFPDEHGGLDTEALEDASTMGGAEPIVLSFGEEPWIILLISNTTASRYTVVIQANGQLAGVVRTPLGERERLVGTHVEIPAEPEDNA